MSDGNGMSLAVVISGEGACSDLGQADLGQDRMRPRYKVSQAGVGLIESFEGFRAKAARLADGGWTIGYGHTRSAREGAEVSPNDASILLKYVDLPPVEEAIHALVFTPLAQNQYDALVAFVFNVGVDAFSASDVLKRLNEGRLTEAACALDLWRKAEISGDPVVLDALIRRRAAEKTLFLTPDEGFVPTPSPLVRPEVDARAAEWLPKRRPVQIEAPLSGETAEVRLVVPFEVEPPLEAPTAFTVELVPAAESLAAAEEAFEEAPTAWTAETAAVPVAEEPAPTAWTAEAAPAEPAAEEPAPTAWTAETAPAEPAAEEPAPTAWTAETAPVEPASEEPAPTAWTAETAVAETPPEEPAPTAWSVGEASNANESPDPEPARRLSPIEIVLAPANAAEPQAVPPEPAATPDAPQRAIPAAEAPVERPFYSSYGPMAFAVRPPRPSPIDPAMHGADEGETVAEPAEAEPQPGQVAAAEPEPEPAQTIQPPPYGEPVVSTARTLSEMAPAPVVTAATAVPQPLVLTSPPADWEENRRSAPAMTTTLAAEADELETPLFDEGWDGPSALSGRIVRHEPVAEPAGKGRRAGATGPYVLLGLIGFVAFAGALFAFWRGQEPGSAMGDPTTLAWALALIGAGCIGISVYFLLRRLGAAED